MSFWPQWQDWKGWTPGPKTYEAREALQKLVEERIAAQAAAAEKKEPDA